MSISQAFEARAQADPALTPTTNVNQVGADGSIGDFYNATTNTFQATEPADGDKPPTSEEGSLPGNYLATVGDLANHTGRVYVTMTANGEAIAAGFQDVQGGKTVFYANANMQQATPADNTTGGQLDKAGTGGGGGGSLSPIIVDASRTWTPYKSDAGRTARQVVTVAQAFNGTLAMNFGDLINPGTRITSVDTVTDDQSTTYTNLLVAQDGVTAHFDLQAPNANQTHKVDVKVTTSDGQTLERTGELRVSDES